MEHRVDKELLKEVLMRIKDHDTDYDVRELYVYEALLYSKHCGYNSGIKIDPAEPDWPVIYIDLPVGQVSWHMPGYNGEYDGHSTEEKYRRINDYS